MEGWGGAAGRPRLADVVLLAVAIPLVAAQVYVLLTLVAYGVGGDLSSDAGPGSWSGTVAFFVGTNLLVYGVWRVTRRARAASKRSGGPR